MSGATDILSMSDEDFAKLNDPSALAGATDDAAAGDTGGTASPGSGETAPTPAAETAGQVADAAGTAPEDGAAAPTGAGDGSTDTGDAKTDETKSSETPQSGDAPAGDTPAGESDPKPDTKAEAPAETPNYQAFYEQVMKPFKANGKTFEVKNPEEAVSLMQMGANYARKMNELQPHRKALMMLQQNNLLDPSKLSFLIDLDKGDPEAIKQFVKDRNIDPLEIDTASDPAYLGDTHIVSDEQVAFQSMMEELSSTPSGTETLQEISGRWDNVSKEALWKNPEIAAVIHEQRESGAYAVIADEVERRRTLGTLKANVPFLEAYHAIGLEFAKQAPAPAAGSSNAAPNPAPVAVPAAPQVLDTRAATPRSPVTANEQAAAASPSRSTPSQPQTTNPQAFLAMSDEEFLKLDQFKGRV